MKIFKALQLTARFLVVAAVANFFFPLSNQVTNISPDQIVIGTAFAAAVTEVIRFIVWLVYELMLKAFNPLREPS
jgi:hypothetical protein